MKVIRHKDEPISIYDDEGKEIGRRVLLDGREWLYIFDEGVFKEMYDAAKECREKIKRLDEDLQKETEKEKKIPLTRRKDSKFNQLIQAKKNKQQFNYNKFDQRAASKLSGKNNMNLRRGGGR